MPGSHSSHRGLNLVPKSVCSAPLITQRGGQPVARAGHAAWWWPWKEQAPGKSGDSSGGVVTSYKTTWARARHSFIHVSPAHHSLCSGILEYILFLLNFLLSWASPFSRGGPQPPWDHWLHACASGRAQERWAKGHATALTRPQVCRLPLCFLGQVQPLLSPRPVRWIRAGCSQLSTHSSCLPPAPRAPVLTTSCVTDVLALGKCSLQYQEVKRRPIRNLL